MGETRTATEEWKWRRRETIIRDEYTCQKCGVKGGPKGDASLEVHHITPVSEGGSDDLDNLKTLCADCHQQSHADLEGNIGHFELEFPPGKFEATVAELDLPTTSDVAEHVGCAHRTALHHLNALEEDGSVSSRMVGRANIWMASEGTQED